MPFDYPVAGEQTSPATGATKGTTVALKPYKVTVYGHETTLMLSDEDAKAQGLLKEKPAAKQAPKAANKSRTAKNKKA